MSMTDEDCVRTFHRVVGVGKVYGPQNYGPDKGWKPRWTWSVQDKHSVRLVLTEMLPYLHGRRAKKAAEALAELEQTGAANYLGERERGCGTRAGYSYHKTHNTEPCLPCLEAMRAYNRIHRTRKT